MASFQIKQIGSLPENVYYGPSGNSYTFRAGIPVKILNDADIEHFRKFDAVVEIGRVDEMVAKVASAAVEATGVVGKVKSLLKRDESPKKKK